MSTKMKKDRFRTVQDYLGEDGGGDRSQNKIF